MLTMQQLCGATHSSNRNGAHGAFSGVPACVPRKTNRGKKGVVLLSFKISESYFSKYFQALELFFTGWEKEKH